MREINFLLDCSQSYIKFHPPLVIVSTSQTCGAVSQHSFHSRPYIVVFITLNIMLWTCLIPHTLTIHQITTSQLTHRKHGALRDPWDHRPQGSMLLQAAINPLLFFRSLQSYFAKAIPIHQLRRTLTSDAIQSPWTRETRSKGLLYDHNSFCTIAERNYKAGMDGNRSKKQKQKSKSEQRFKL